MTGPNFSFSTNVPQANQKISATQVPISNNFQAISEWLNINHVGFSDDNNYGKHNLTTLQQVPGNIDPTTLSTEMSVYCKSVSGDSSGYELFARYPSNGAIEQLTGSAGSPLSGGTSYAYINSGLLIKWGTINVKTVPVTIVYPVGTGIPIFTTSVQIVQVSQLCVPSLQIIQFTPYNLTTTSFGIECGGSYTFGSTYTLSWIAIGI